jgi:hypothetical protein
MNEQEDDLVDHPVCSVPKNDLWRTRVQASHRVHLMWNAATANECGLRWAPQGQIQTKGKWPIFARCAGDGPRSLDIRDVKKGGDFSRPALPNPSVLLQTIGKVNPRAVVQFDAEVVNRSRRTLQTRIVLGCLVEDPLPPG